MLAQVGMTADRKVRTDGTVSFPIRIMFADEWYDLHNPVFVADTNDYGFGPGQVKPPYLMQFEVGRLDLPPNEIDHRLQTVNVAMRHEAPLEVPIELTFRPAGGTVEYAVEADYDWDPASASGGPVSVAAFSRRRSGPAATWQQASTPVGDLAPFGTWRLRLRNENAASALVSVQH
ncbi:MAG: hypothetical protein ACRDWH_09785, partial [Acidimicrobiia bacterium]